MPYLPASCLPTLRCASIAQSAPLRRASRFPCLSQELTVDYGKSYIRNYPSGSHRAVTERVRTPAEDLSPAHLAAPRFPRLPGWFNPARQPASRPAFALGPSGIALVCPDTPALVRARREAVGLPPFTASAAATADADVVDVDADAADALIAASPPRPTRVKARSDRSDDGAASPTAPAEIASEDEVSTPRTFVPAAPPLARKLRGSSSSGISQGASNAKLSAAAKAPGKVGGLKRPRPAEPTGLLGAFYAASRPRQG